MAGVYSHLNELWSLWHLLQWNYCLFLGWLEDCCFTWLLNSWQCIGALLFFPAFSLARTKRLLAGIWDTALECCFLDASIALSRHGTHKCLERSRIQPIPRGKQSCGYLLLSREYKSIFLGFLEGFFFKDILSKECWSLATVCVHCAELVKLFPSVISLFPSSVFPAAVGSWAFQSHPCWQVWLFLLDVHLLAGWRSYSHRNRTIAAILSAFPFWRGCLSHSSRDTGKSWLPLGRGSSLCSFLPFWAEPFSFFVQAETWRCLIPPGTFLSTGRAGCGQGAVRVSENRSEMVQKEILTPDTKWDPPCWGALPEAAAVEYPQDLISGYFLFSGK